MNCAALCVLILCVVGGSQARPERRGACITKYRPCDAEGDECCTEGFDCRVPEGTRITISICVPMAVHDQQPSCVEQGMRCAVSSDCCNSKLTCDIPDSDDGTVLKIKRCVDPISVSCIANNGKCYSDGACCSSDHICDIPWNVRTRIKYCVPKATGSLP